MDTYLSHYSLTGTVQTKRLRLTSQISLWRWVSTGSCGAPTSCVVSCISSWIFPAFSIPAMYRCEVRFGTDPAGFLTTYDPDTGIDNCALQRG